MATVHYYALVKRGKLLPIPADTIPTDIEDFYDYNHVGDRLTTVWAKLANHAALTTLNPKPKLIDCLLIAHVTGTYRDYITTNAWGDTRPVEKQAPDYIWTTLVTDGKPGVVTKHHLRDLDKLASLLEEHEKADQ